MSFQNFPPVLSNLRVWNEKRIIEERKYQSRESHFLCGFDFSVRVLTAGLLRFPPVPQACFACISYPSRGREIQARL